MTQPSKHKQQLTTGEQEKRLHNLIKDVASYIEPNRRIPCDNFLFLFFLQPVMMMMMMMRTMI